MRTLIVLVIVLFVTVADTSALGVLEEPGQEAEVLKAQTAGQNPTAPDDQLKNQAPLANSGAMSEKERAEVFLGLMRLAYERYDKIVETNWRVRFAVWMAFGLATSFVLASDKWRPNRTESILASLIAVGIVVTVNFIWGPYQHERVTRWSRTANYWGSAVEATVKAKLPDKLQVTSLGKDGWLRYQEDHASATDRPPWHRSSIYVSCAVITALFGLLFIGAILGRTSWQNGQRHKPLAQGQARLTEFNEKER